MDEQTPQDIEHRFLKFESTNPSVSQASELAAYILNKYAGNNLSVTKYRQAKKLILTSKETLKKSQVRFDDIVKRIIESSSFENDRFHCPPLFCNWLDSAELRHNVPRMKDATGELRLSLPTPFSNFPLIPTLDCEGILFTSFQTPIQKSILRLHNILVEESHRILGDQYLEWLNDLRMLLNDCISLVDITLHQLYFAAEYGLVPGWRFDPNKLGQRHGVRVNDKFRWIGLITGRPLDNARDEVDSFNVLRGVRNHFNHFDPPCVAISVDDAADWINRVPKIGRLLWKIREKLGAQLTQELVRMILLPKAIVDPQIEVSSRGKQALNAGYKSSTW